MLPLVLASASEARRRLIRLLVPDAEFCAAAIDESPQEGERCAAICVRLAVEKAGHVAAGLCGQGRDAVVLGADTLAHLGGEVFGKPSNEGDAARILRALSGKSHAITTGLGLYRAFAAGGPPAELARDSVTTQVRFRALTEDEIRAYVATGEPMTRSGAYGLQGAGGALVQSVDGCPNNVVGLPLGRVLEMLRAAGVETRLG